MYKAVLVLKQEFKNTCKDLSPIEIVRTGFADSQKGLPKCGYSKGLILKKGTGQKQKSPEHNKSGHEEIRAKPRRTGRATPHNMTIIYIYIYLSIQRRTRVNGEYIY